MAVDYEQARKDLERAQHESYSTKDEFGLYSDIFRTDVPEGLSKWKCKEAEHLIDIIPFVIGNNHPSKKAGSVTYLMDVFVHNRIGPRKQEFLCRARTLNEPCPVCEHQDKLTLGNAEEDVVKALNPVRRCIYNIICYDTPQEEAKGIQVWYIAHFFMERKITGIAKKPKGGGSVYFSDVKEGKHISFERIGSGKDNTRYENHQFVIRDEALDVSMIEKAYQLDELIHFPTYEEVNNALMAAPEEEDDVSAEGVPEPDDTPTPEPETPPEEEAAPPEGEDACPAGHVFGKDNDEKEDCNGCPVWGKCADEAERMEQEKKAKREEKRGADNASPELKVRGRGK